MNAALAEPAVELHPALEWSNFARHIRIRDRYTRRFVPFGESINVVQQEKLYDPWREADLVGRPFRALVVKARQMGFSTAIQTRFFHRACCWENVSLLTVANLDETTKELHNMAEDAYAGLPGPLRPRLKSGGAVGNTMRFAHGSSIRTWTAGTKEIARGFALFGGHLSEAAYYADLVKSLDAMLQAVPDVGGTAVVVESTAHGIGDPFHQEWMQAIEGNSGFLPIFAGWHEYPHYRLAERYWPARLERELTDEELSLMETFGIDLEQVAWRRHILATKCRGNIDTLHQEYPITWEEAFIASGAQFFQPQLITNFARLAQKTEPKLVGELKVTKSPDDKPQVQAVPRVDGPLTAFEAPRPGHRYAIWADVAGDVSDDEIAAFRSRESAQDYNVAAVFDLRTITCAAVYRAQMDIDVFGQQLAHLGWLYNHALIAPEVTGGYGLVVVRELRDLHYRRIYVRRALDDISGQWTQKLGWATTEATRPIMLENLRTFLRDHPERLRYRQLAQEMVTFIVTRRNKAQASPGSHDDIVMAFAGALELCAENPQPSTKAERMARRADAEKKAKAKKTRGKPNDRYERSPDDDGDINYPY